MRALRDLAVLAQLTATEPVGGDSTNASVSPAAPSAPGAGKPRLEISGAAAWNHHSLRRIAIEAAGKANWPSAKLATFTTAIKGGRTFADVRAVVTRYFVIATPSLLVTSASVAREESTRSGGQVGRRVRNGLVPSRLTLTDADLDAIRAAVRGELRAALAPERAPAEWIGDDEAAELLGFSRSYLALAIQRHGIPVHRAGRARRFKRSQLETWLRRRDERSGR